MRTVTVSWKQGKFIVTDQGIVIWSGPPELWHFLQDAIHGAGIRFTDQTAMQRYLRNFPN
jgi:hypothetical protein